jgi:hypothetical protein
MRFCPLLLIPAICTACATCLVNEAQADYSITRGRQVLLDRGFQLQALTFTLPQDGITDLNLWRSANFSTLNFWTRSDVYSAVFPKLPPGQQWGRVWQGQPETGDGLWGQEIPYRDSLVDMQWYDEVSNTMQRLPEIATQFRTWNSSHPRALAHANFYGNQLSAANLSAFVQATKPDIITFDQYPSLSFSNSQRNTWYSTMQMYRTTALAGYTTDAGTNSGPLPYGQFLNLFRDSYSAATPSESFIRLQQNASSAFGYSWLSAFTYNRPVGLPDPLYPVMFNSDGDTSPSTVFSYVAEANRETRNLGSALVRMVSTGVFMKPGSGKSVSGTGLSGWISRAGTNASYSDYMTSIIPTVSQGGASDTNYSDVLVGYFNPLLANDTGYPSADGLRFMIVNGAAAGTASASAQWYHLTFDFTGTDFDSLVRVSRGSGLMELVPLTNLGGSMASLDLNLPGGTGDLFGFWNSNNPLPTLPVVRVLIDQKFDDTGVFVAGSQLNLSGVGNSSTTAGLWRQGLAAPGGTITGVQAFSANQSIKTVRSSFGPGQVLGYVDDGSGATSGYAVTSFRFQRETSTSAASFRLGYSADIAAFANINLGIEINGDGSVNVVDNANPVQILTGVTSGSWHAFKLLIDIDSKEYDVYYSADATDSAFHLIYSSAIVPMIYSNGGSVNCMWFGPNFDGGTVYFDNAYLAAAPLVTLPGDYNDDGIVDAADYVVWRKFRDTENVLPNDPLGGIISEAQYDQWRINIGRAEGGRSLAGSAIPEPKCYSIVVVGLVAACLCAHRSHHLFARS